MNSGIRKYIYAVVGFIGLLLFVRHLLPLFLPFLLGAGLAVAAEPLVAFLCRRLHFRRSLATGLGITMSFCLLTLAAMVLCAFAIRELRTLARVLPELEEPLSVGMNTASTWLRNLAGQAPGELSRILTQNVDSFFSEGNALLGKSADYLLKLASSILSHVPDSALGLGAGIISSFMISAKLPKIRQLLTEKLPHDKLEPIVSAAGRMKSVLVGWLKAQIKLSGVNFLLILAGLFLLRVPHAPLWALLTALVDAFPILGTGAILVPWSIVSFLQGDRLLAFGLLGLYAAAALTRTVLEPKFLGKHLGLDPLVTLIALYIGYRLWGIGGMILAPILAVAATQLTVSSNQPF